MLWGTRDGVSPGGNDATCTLRWTVDVAFAKRRRGGVDVDVVVFRGSNHTVFCDPPDDTDFFRMGRRATSTADASVISYATSLPSLSLRGGEKSEDAAPARASRPRMPSCLLHHSESLRCAPSLSGDPPAVTRVVSGVNGDDGDDWENDATCPSSRDGPAESCRFSDCRDIVICPNPRHDGRPATILTAPTMPSEGGVTMVEWAV